MISLDNTDLKILRALQDDGKIRNNELADKVNLSPTPCLKRVKKLEDSGVIKGYHADLDPAKVGLNISSLVLLKMGDNRRAAVDEFSAAVKKIPAITDCHLTTGRWDYVARVFAKDFNDYEIIIKDDLAALPYLVSMETLFLFSNVGSSGGFKFSN